MYQKFLQMFAAGENVNTSTGIVNAHTGAATPASTGGLSAEDKTFYDTVLLKGTKPRLYHLQFGKKTSLPKGRGTTVEWRKWQSFQKAIEPLQEGVTPDGNKLNIYAETAKVHQYGNYTEIADVIQTAAIDPLVLECTEEHAKNAAETMDTVARNVLCAGTNVLYAPSVTDGVATPVTSRANLDSKCLMTAAVIRKAVTILRKNNVDPIDGENYVAIIHPSIEHDICSDPAWIDAHKYSAAKEIFDGEVGTLHGCRFVRTSEAKLFSNSNGTVYASLFLGKDAYGVVDPEGAGLELIVKALGSAGAADPLNQRSTVGWKASMAVKILFEERMLRVESFSTFSNEDEPND